MGRTTDEWFENIEEDLRYGLSLRYETEDPLVIEDKYQEIKKNFPKSEPYILTHGDLNLTNIIVKDDKIEAIIDWEYSGYLPWWAERWLSLIGGND
jgi:thiamine kinase-like enzyme